MAIGIFDSGSGGLTVMRALDRALPAHDLVYLGDHANAPYGDRAAGDIYALTVQGVQRLFEANCRLVILACNTAAAHGLRRLQRNWLPRAHPHHRVLGVIVPVVEEVTGVPWVADAVPVPRPPAAAQVAVAVFATRHTVESGAFAGEIHKRTAHVDVWQQTCPDLVPLIEADAPEPVLRAAVEAYVGQLAAQMHGRLPDVCILGCTHYPLIEPVFRAALPATTRILSQPEVTARSLLAYLERHPDFAATGSGRRVFLTTGDPARAGQIATRFYGRPVVFQALADHR
ncbi:glutamate racemase [Xanthobacter sp. ZOL 2024]